jgi:hypothetical protein
VADNDQTPETQEQNLDPRAATIARWFSENPDQIPEKFRNAENPA